MRYRRKRFVAVSPTGKKTVSKKKVVSTNKKSSANARPRLAYRLLNTLDDAVRTLMKRRGDLTAFMIEALETANLNEMPLVDIGMESKAAEVNMFIPVELYQRVHAAAETLSVSLNVIVNSAMARWLRKKGLIEIHAL
jgi:hypothetical protein